MAKHALNDAWIGEDGALVDMHGEVGVVEMGHPRQEDVVGDDDGDAAAHDGIKEASARGRVAARHQAEGRVVHQLDVVGRRVLFGRRLHRVGVGVAHDESGKPAQVFDDAVAKLASTGRLRVWRLHAGREVGVAEKRGQQVTPCSWVLGCARMSCVCGTYGSTTEWQRLKALRILLAGDPHSPVGPRRVRIVARPVEGEKVNLS